MSNLSGIKLGAVMKYSGRGANLGYRWQKSEEYLNFNQGVVAQTLSNLLQSKPLCDSSCCSYNLDRRFTKEQSQYFNSFVLPT